MPWIPTFLQKKRPIKGGPFTFQKRGLHPCYLMDEVSILSQVLFCHTIPTRISFENMYFTLSNKRERWSKTCRLENLAKFGNFENLKM